MRRLFHHCTTQGAITVLSQEVPYREEKSVANLVKKSYLVVITNCTLEQFPSPCS